MAERLMIEVENTGSEPDPHVLLRTPEVLRFLERHGWSVRALRRKDRFDFEADADRHWQGGGAK